MSLCFWERGWRRGGELLHRKKGQRPRPSSSHIPLIFLLSHRLLRVPLGLKKGEERWRRGG